MEFELINEISQIEIIAGGNSIKEIQIFSVYAALGFYN